MDAHLRHYVEGLLSVRSDKEVRRNFVPRGVQLFIGDSQIPCRRPNLVAPRALADKAFTRTFTS